MNSAETGSVIELLKRVAALEAALRKLANEAGGSLRGFEPEVRDAIGNTNWECVMLRVREAAALLLPTSETSVCQYCGKALPEGCSTEFEGESGCEGYPAKTKGDAT